jgi:hypothetical protein
MNDSTDLDHNKLTRYWNGLSCVDCNANVFPDHDAFGRALVDCADAIAVHVKAGGTTFATAETPSAPPRFYRG